MNKNVILEEGKTYLNKNLSGIKVYNVQQDFISGSNNSLDYKAILLGPDDDLSFGSDGPYIQAYFVLLAKKFPVKTIDSSIDILSCITDNFILVEEELYLRHVKCNFISACFENYIYQRINAKAKELVETLEQYI